jgi:hypothetical protein
VKVRKFIDKTANEDYDVLVIKAEAAKVKSLYDKKAIFAFFQMSANGNGGFVIQRYFQRALEQWALKRVTSLNEREEFSEGLDRHYHFEKYTRGQVQIYFNYVFSEFQRFGLIDYGKVYVQTDRKGRSQVYRTIRVTKKGAQVIV